MVNINGVSTPVSFLIIDLPGREEIAPTFINKYVDINTNPILYNVIKDGFIADTRNPEYKKLFDPSVGDIGDNYMKELKAMLCGFTLNPLSVPIYSCEIIEQYIKDNYTSGKNLKTEIFEKKIPRKYILRGERNGQFIGNEIIFEKDISLIDEFYDTNYNEKIKIDDPIYSDVVKKNDDGTQTPDTFDDSKLQNIYIISKELFNSKFGWYTFNNLLTIEADGTIKKIDTIREKEKGKPIKAVEKWNTDNQTSLKIKDVANLKKLKGVVLKGKLQLVTSAFRFPYGLENDTYNGRQIKTLFLINFMRRLYDLQRFDILNELFEKIINEKINYYIEQYIINADDTKCKQLVDDLITNNFKREALREKFLLDKKKPSDGNIAGYIQVKNGTTANTIDRSFNIINLDGSFKEGDKQQTDIQKYLYDAIKYDFYTTGYEGVYINENIIGLIKYLGKDGKPKVDASGNNVKDTSGNIIMNYLIQNPVDRDMIEIDLQDKNNTFDLGNKLSKLIQISRIEAEGKQKSTSISSEDINTYGLEAIQIIKGVGTASVASSTPDWKKGLAAAKAEKKGNTSVSFLEPRYTKYNKIKKLKIFDIKNDNYLSQLFTKKSTTATGEKPASGSLNTTGAAPTNDKEISPPAPLIPSFGDYYYDPSALDEVFSKTLNTYKSSKIFCYDQPIIKSILEPYLDIINDFKIFYLFGNYTKATRELKCAQQFELLETTNNFIEAITR